MNGDLPIYKVGNTQASPTAWHDKDSRGFLWMWEPPIEKASYVIGVDPTQGIAQWSRAGRTGSDTKTDNAAIEVVRLGTAGNPDVQVAEYAAPVTPIELAPILNHIGHLYHGSNEENEAHIIIEVYPGPGLLLQHELMSKYGYSNIYQPRYLNTRNAAIPRGQPYGWTASRQSVTDLWVMGLHHINNKRVRINSPWLVDEMADCVRDESSMQLKACFGAHDDMIRAFLLALWAAHDWTGAESDESSVVEEVNAPSWQASHITAAQMMEDANARFADLLDD